MAADGSWGVEGVVGETGVNETLRLRPRGRRDGSDTVWRGVVGAVNAMADSWMFRDSKVGTVD